MCVNRCLNIIRSDIYVHMSICIVAKVVVCCMHVCLHSCVSPHVCNCVSDLYGYIYMCCKDRHVNVVQTAAFITVCNFGSFQAYYYICFLPGLDLPRE